MSKKLHAEMKSVMSHNKNLFFLFDELMYKESNRGKKND